MTAFLATLLRLSLLGSLLAGVLFLLKPLLRGRISRAAAYYLWLLVLLRLCIPAGLTLHLPAQDIPAAPDRVQTAAPARTEQSGGPTVPAQTAAAPAQTAPAMPPITPVTLPLTAERLLAGIWAAGFVLMWGWYLDGYDRLARRIRKTAAPAGGEAQAILARLDPLGRVRLVESEAVNSPLLVGLFHPTIALPVGLTDPVQLRDILSHELTHARRGDLLYKWFAAFAVSLHWFNPLMLLVRREIGRACELACDEAVIKTLDAPARKHYGETLLALAAGPNRLALPMCGEKRNLKERLASLVHTPRKGPLTFFLTVALVLTIGSCALVSGAHRPEAAPGPSSVTLPQTGVTLRLGMTRREVTALLGRGEGWYISQEEEKDTVAYNTKDGLLLVDFSDYLTTSGYVNSLSCLSGSGYPPSLAKEVTQEAQELYRQAGPFQLQAMEGTGYGTSLAQLQARFPQGERYTTSNSEQNLPEGTLMTVYEVPQGEVTVVYFLTEETGVYQIYVTNRWSSYTRDDWFTNPAGDPFLPLMDRETVESFLGDGEPQGNSSVYTDRDGNTLTVRYTESGCTLEALGSGWESCRGVHNGDTLTDITDRYDGSIQRDETGRFFSTEGDYFTLRFYLTQEDTVSSMVLAEKGDVS